MAYARPYGQAQNASPWSSGVPPGLQQQQQQPTQQMQPMFNQPMGAFDVSGAWGQGQQQWVQPMQPVQFVPNPAYVQQPQMRQQQQQQHQQQQQRPMHQRSLSAPRVGANGLKRPMNASQNNAGGQQQHWQRGQQNNQNQQSRVTRQQSRMNNQRGQSNSNNSNTNTNNNRQQNQQQQQQNQQNTRQALRKGPAKVTKVKKQAALKAKHNGKPVASGNKVESTADSTATDNGAVDASAAGSDQPVVAQSKTAARKQLKLQARKNAEALNQSKLPVAKATRVAGAESGDDPKVDEPIDQAQLKCVPAVFGFVCKLCDVFLRDKIARREHIDSDDHMEKFRIFEEEQKIKEEEAAAAAAAASETPAASALPAEESASEEAEKEIKIEAEVTTETEANSEAEVKSGTEAEPVTEVKLEAGVEPVAEIDIKAEVEPSAV